MLESRRDPRIYYSGMVFISWKTFQGQRNHVLGRCLDVSKQGVGLALSVRIPVGAFVKVKAHGLNYEGSGTVRHVSLRSGRYVLGLQLSSPVDENVLAALCEAQDGPLTTAAAAQGLSA